MALLENEIKLEQFGKEIKDETSMDKKLKIIFLNEYNEIIGDILNIKQELFIDQVKEGVSLLLEDFYTINCLTDQKLSKLVENNLNEIKSRYNQDYTLINKVVTSFDKIKKKRINNDNFLSGFRKHCIHTDDLACHNCCSNEKDGDKNSHFLIVNDPDSKNSIKFVVCENCKKVYYSSFILAHCFGCGLDYYTSLLSPEENPELLLATWENYHCRQLINEKMKCIKCDEPFYVNMKTGLLMCLNKKCEFISKPTRILWTCSICKAEFKSAAIPYNPLDVIVTKKLVSQTLLLKHKAHPDEMPCCKINVFFTDFYHKLTCDGILYESELDDSKVIVCEKCKAINFYDRFNWTCPKCRKRFRSKYIIPSNHNTYNNTLKALKQDNNSNRNSNKKEKEKEREEIDNKYLHSPNPMRYSSKRFKKNNNIRGLRLNDNNPVEEEYNHIHNNTGIDEKKTENEKKIDSSRKFRRFNFNYIQENKSKNEEKEKNEEKNKNEENNDDNNDNENENENDNNNIGNRKTRSKTTYYKEGKKRREEAKRFFRRFKYANSKEKDKENIIIEEKGTEQEEHEPERISPSHWRKRFKRDIISNDEKEKRELEEKERREKEEKEKEKEKREKEEKEEKEKKKNNNNNNLRGWLRRLNKDPVDKPTKYVQKEKQTEFVDNDEESEENNTIEDDKKKNKIKNGKSDEEDEKEKEENPVDPDPLYMNYKFKRNRNKKNTHGMEIPGDQDQDENKDEVLMKKKSIPQIKIAMSKIPGISEQLFNHINKRMNKILNRCKIPVFNVDDYTFNKKLGQGGYAVIFCVNKNDDKEHKYAIKKIIAKTLTEIDRFTKEFELVHSCIHPNIMKIYGICIRMLDQTTYALYVLMELSLCDWNKEIKMRLMKKNNYKEEELISILRQLTSALLFMQQNLKISHRDIKPSNILIFKDGLYKIADFGEAKEAKMSKQMNTLRGTELYMSPALYSGLKNEKNDVNHDPYKSDVFSLGFCFLYAASLDMELLYQIRDIFNSKKIDAILQHQLKKKYSHTFINLLSKMLEIDEIERFDFPKIEKYIDDNYDKDGILKNSEKIGEKIGEKRTELNFKSIIKKYK